MVTIQLRCFSSFGGTSFKRSFVLDVCHPGFVAGRDGSCPSSEPAFVTLWVTALPLIVRPAEVPKLCPWGVTLAQPIRCLLLGLCVETHTLRQRLLLIHSCRDGSRVSSRIHGHTPIRGPVTRLELPSPGLLGVDSQPSCHFSKPPVPGPFSPKITQSWLLSFVTKHPDL